MKLNATLPKDNGLAAIEGQLLKQPDQAVRVVALVDVKQITTDMDTHDREATARITAIEVVRRDDEPSFDRLFREALAQRTGAQQFDFPPHDDDQAPVEAELLELEAGVGDVEHHPDCDGDCLDGETIDIGEPDDDPFADDNEEVAA